ncbi:MAG: LamG-like jellyroll fold domain-containing protein, partial [Bacteroidales bacterium]
MKAKIYFTLFFLFFSLSTFSQIFEKQGAGVTLIVHGWNPDGDQPAWMNEMANAIIERTNNQGHIANITVSGTQGNLTAECSNWTFDLSSQDHAELIILVNWTAVANHLTTEITAQEVAAAIAPRLYEPQNGQPALSELPIHLIGHSRGGGMVFEIARLLGLEGIEVEHLTALDPHPLTAADPQPVSGNVIDTPVQIYENVLFVDNYYQNIEYPEGQYINGAYNRLWTSMPGGYHNETGYTYTIGFDTYNFSDHLNIILAYHGTIDLNTPATNGEATLTQTERDNWFIAYENAGENVGFKYSRQILGDRKSSDIPNSGDAIIDGYHNDALLGGNGIRESLDWTNAVWPNILETTIAQNGTPITAGAYVLSEGDILNIESACRSYANASTITIYADLDRNPYNSNEISLEPLNLAATGNVITLKSANWMVNGLTPGEKYYLYIEIDDNTRKRFFYAPYEFEYQIPSIHDLSVTNIVKPVKHFENSEITIEIFNNGNQTETDFPLSYTVEGNTITEAYTGSIAPSETVQYTFTQTTDLSVENIYSITAKTELASDDNTTNDEFSTQINTYVNPNTLFFIYDDYVAVPNNPALNFTDDFTIETWFYAHSTKVIGKVISKHGNDGTTRSGYSIEYDGSNIKAVVGIGGTWATVSAPAATDQWHHVAMVYSSGILEMYFNGMSQGTASGTILTNDLDLYIGASQQYGDNWTGYIEELRIWNDARTETEIQDNMNSEINPQSENLLAYYDFNRGIPVGDNTAIEYLPDMTDNNFHGSMHNFALQEGLPDGNFFEDCNLDLTAPVPDLAELEDITAECEVASLTAPTATDNCSGEISATHNATLPITSSTTITWTYEDTAGNISTQTQEVIIEDLTAPVPDLAELEDITAECEVASLTAPTATD